MWSLSAIAPTPTSWLGSQGPQGPGEREAWVSGQVAVARPRPKTTFNPPPNQDKPRSTAGSGTRNLASCRYPGSLGPSLESSLRPEAPGTALMSRLQGPIALGPGKWVGLTQMARPRLWVYLPQTDAKTLELSLFDQRAQGVYQTNLRLPLSVKSKAGLMEIPWPQDAPALALGQTYEWTIALVCNPQERSQDLVTRSWIRREVFPAAQSPLPQAPSPQRLSQSVSPIAQVDRYAQHGFWYDALNQLLTPELPSAGGFSAETSGAVQQSPQTWFQTWYDLLQSVGLEGVTKAPILTL